MTADRFEPRIDTLKAELRAAHSELSKTNSELMRLTLELDDRVAERTAELAAANEFLRVENEARRSAENLLRQQAELIDKANDTIVTVDMENRITFWSQGAGRLLGWGAPEVLGRPMIEIFGAIWIDGAAVSPADAGIAGDWQGEVSATCRNGGRLTMKASVTILRGEAGSPAGRLLIGCDITNEKAIQEKLLRAQRLENIGLLAAGIAHDFNNVLAPVSMTASLLRSSLTEPNDLHLLDIIEKSSVRGSALVRQILGFARGVGGEMQDLQVKYLLADIASIIAATFPKSIILEKHLPADLWLTTGNHTHIHQVVLNLCVNARDAMPGGGRLCLKACNCHLDEPAARAIEDARPGAWVVLQIADTGTGIAPEVRARIWDPFFTTKADAKGTGLGLSTVRGIVKSHHGFITMDSELGRGTTFCVYLAAKACQDVLTPGQPRDQLARRAGGELILVVEDEADNREVMAKALTAVGYQVVTASDGAEAAALVLRRGAELALVISDYRMPYLDGGGLLKLIRTHRPDLKVILVSGDAEINGAAWDAHIIKPLNLDILLSAISKQLGSSP